MLLLLLNSWLRMSRKIFKKTDHVSDLMITDIIDDNYDIVVSKSRLETVPPHA